MKLTCILSQPDCARKSEYEVCKKCCYDFGANRVNIENKQYDIEQAKSTYLKNYATDPEQRLPQLKMELRNYESQKAGNTAIDSKQWGFIIQDAAWSPSMKVLPAGHFMMGADNTTQNPGHKVTIKNRYAIGQYLVTFDDWEKCYQDGGVAYMPDDLGFGKGKRPVINVSWLDAQSFVQWLNKKLNLNESSGKYMLPSEAQWEYACRAGTQTDYNNGKNEISLQEASFFDTASNEYKSSPVGSYQANNWQLFDMHGNVWEWVQDTYEPYSAEHPTDGSPYYKGIDSNREFMVLRGGSWYNIPSHLRASGRIMLYPANRVSNAGFRLARSMP